MSPILRAHQVKKSFGDFEALRGVDLEVKRGECVGLLGPNGAGKSTFINVTYGASLRSGGELEVFGLDPSKNSSQIKARLGVVPQENALDDALTVIENMRIFARFVGLTRIEADPRIEELLTYMALDHKKDAPIRSLSGGMKRRLAFVRALLSDPELLILDEPTTGLDPAVRHLLWQRVHDLRRRGKTILITTHYMHEAEMLCDRIVILNQGRIVDENTPRALIEKHSPGYVSIFHGDEGFANQLRGAVPSDWHVYRQQDTWCVRAPELNSLVDFQKSHALHSLQMRPANLEDVYLKLTGEELSQND
ncbi:MAG TPA: ABC transporter ATP-binding protein [Bdellovibrionota bacterium]|jgi:lipooligosaccharide transport system ATP-binding protein|nr:ABC transporter ATP-binding protein [Bdellovibrionota bacterium]